MCGLDLCMHGLGAFLVGGRETYLHAIYHCSWCCELWSDLVTVT